MVPEQIQLPLMPEIGHPEVYYARLVKEADRTSNQHAREAAKVGQYITLALDPYLEWEQKLRYFQHALRRHCVPPRLPRDEIWIFYAELSTMVRQYAGMEALRLASKEDDIYAKRLAMGQLREKIVAEAAEFFPRLLGTGDERPPHFNQEDWEQLKMVRNQWL